ncbi:DUF2399 domain-containing protein [Nocardia sp. CC216A]|uniref:DUF2399 domain-containing protein n=1 Tax=unclassified Nocardia TaxID=2637762 RepID=UPI003558AB3F
MAAWDAELAPTLHRHGVRIEEELVLDELIGDLAPHRRPLAAGWPDGSPAWSPASAVRRSDGDNGEQRLDSLEIVRVAGEQGEVVR